MASGSGLAATPPMGWNSWNGFGSRVSQDVVRQTADALASSGLRDLGYRYVVIDDCRSLPRRGKSGELVPDPQRFPGGIKPLVDYVHGLGMKLGIYSDAAELTCAGHPGSFGFEDQDAALWASWGVDLLKYDYCHAPAEQLAAIERYTRMGEALRKTGREILFSVCEWGGRNPHLWARRAGAHSWRVTPDVLDSWTDIWVQKNSWTGFGIDSAIELAVPLAEHAGPGGWNDLDMLVVGLSGKGSIPGADIRSMDANTREILANPELVAVNQDPLGRQAARARQAGSREIWKKPLADGSRAYALLNRGTTVADIPLPPADAGVLDSFRGVVRDLWKRQDIADYSPGFSVKVQPHQTMVLRLAP